MSGKTGRVCWHGSAGLTAVDTDLYTGFSVNLVLPGPLTASIWNSDPPLVLVIKCAEDSKGDIVCEHVAWGRGG